MKYILKLYWYIYNKFYDDRLEERWECPTCHWDSTNDDQMENAKISDYSGGYYDWSCTAHWTCPRCKTKFETNESN